MYNLTKDIADILALNGFGSIGEDIFVSEDLPPKPDTVLTVSVIGTSTPDYPSIDISAPIIRIMSRASKGAGQKCEATIFEVKDFMKSIAGLEVNDSRYIQINHLFGPIDMGVDATMRPSYQADFAAIRTGFSLPV